MSDDVSRNESGISPEVLGSIVGAWRGPLTWLEEDESARRRDQEIICVIRESRVPGGKGMAFVFSVDDEHLASAETLNVERAQSNDGWTANGILQVPGRWFLCVECGRLIGTYLDKESGKPVKRFEARRMMAL